MLVILYSCKEHIEHRYWYVSTCILIFYVSIIVKYLISQYFEVDKCIYNIYFCFDKHKVKQRLNIGPSPAREKWFGYVFARSEGMRGASTRARNLS